MTDDTEHKPKSVGTRLLTAFLLTVVMSLPLLAVYALISGRQSQSQFARTSIVEGWGGPQTIAGPFLRIPYVEPVQSTTMVNGQAVTNVTQTRHALLIAPTRVTVETSLASQLRRRSIYDAAVFEADVRAGGVFPAIDLGNFGIPRDRLRPAEAEIVFAIASARGLVGTPPTIAVNDRAVPLAPASGVGAPTDSAFSGAVTLAELTGAPVRFAVTLSVRGSDSFRLAPAAQDTVWRVRSPWPDPSFQGGFLPAARHVGPGGFTAEWRVGNLALGRPLVSADRAGGDEANAIGVALINPVDLYSKVDRSVKYGFLIIGATLVTLALFEVLAGARVSTVGYVLVGAALVLFFVLLLALAEVIGFGPAYVAAAAATVSLITAYATALLGGFRRAVIVGGVLAGLYGVLYALLSLETYALLIGALLLFVALAAIMWLTRNVDWSRRSVARTVD